MDLIYTENSDWSFQHWIDLELTLNQDDIVKMMDVNQWVADRLGAVGDEWGYERQKIILPHPPGLNPVKVQLFYTKIRYSWRFKKKEDAMMFKLTFGGK